MENNEIMFEEIEAIGDIIQENGSSRIGNGVAVLVGVGIAVAVGAGVKFGKKAIAAIKAKRAERKSGEVIVVDEAE